MRLQCSFHPAHLPPCYNRALPYSKVCHKHVMEDKHQVLYKPCTHMNSRRQLCVNHFFFFFTSFA